MASLKEPAPTRKQEDRIRMARSNSMAFLQVKPIIPMAKTTQPRKAVRKEHRVSVQGPISRRLGE